MNKLFLYILLIPLSLYSLEKTSSLETGMQYYKDKDYKKSYEIFSKIYLEHLTNPNFNFSLGKSAYETGNYQIALAAFERVEMQDPSNIHNRLEMARTYYMLHMFEDSQYAFEDVLDNPNIPENVRTNIELSLSKVRRVQEKSFTYARAMIDVIYDSNVNYGSIGDYQYGGGTLSKTKSLDDIAIQTFANVVNIYDIGNKNGFAVKNSFSVFSKEYLGLDNYSLLQFSYMPSLIYKETKYTAEIALGADTLMLGGEKYLNSFSLKPSFLYTLTPTLNLVTYLKYQRKDFTREGLDDLDSDRYEVAVGLQDILTPRSFIAGNIIGVKEEKLRGNNLNVDFSEYKANLTYINQFSPDYALNAFTQVRLRDYDDYSSGFASVRKDIGSTTNLGLTYNIFSTLSANVKGSYEYVDSNQDLFTYHKYTLGAGLVKSF